MKTTDFDFELPEALIAQFPTKDRTASRLLHLGGKVGLMEDLQFKQLIDLLNPNDLLVFNDTKVIKARLYGTKPTGGAVELLVERILDEHRVIAQIKSSKALKPQARFRVADQFDVEVLGREEDMFMLYFHHTLTDSQPILTLLDQHGALPLPPYIAHAADQEDESRYQTVYAKSPGAVAAPTAGLHFDDTLLAAMAAKGIRLAYVTLHVGAGTFQPVRVDDISQHKMHSELFTVPEETMALISETKALQGNVVAVGTTSLRALESAARSGVLNAGSGDTDIFITPGYQFQVVDRLITNFHLPKSTLMMLVSAFAGIAPIKRAYAHAIAQQYRFFSYGDAMLLERE